MKRETYWDVGGCGELRRQLSECNWHSLPVLKGKFYQHPGLMNTGNQLSLAERTRLQKAKEKHQMMQQFARAEPLPGEALTASVLEEIYPRAPGTDALFEGAETETRPPITRPATPTGDGLNKTHANLEGARGRLGHRPAGRRSVAWTEVTHPVRTMEDLRRRWLASGLTTMAQAISIMDENGITSNKRLSLKDFGEALSRVHVTDQSEHVALFSSIVDLHDRNAKVTISELASAVATVSPALYLEDIRHRLVKKYGHQHVEKAFWDLDPDRSGLISKVEFHEQAVRRLGLTEMEAYKTFREIDVDGSGFITKGEFLRALSMSEASLFYEDLRRKVRQRFHSIKSAFTAALENTNDADAEEQPKIDFSRFEEILNGMEFSEDELRTLFTLVDANDDGSVTIREFVHGIRHFTPSCVLEDLRLICILRHEHISDTFVRVQVDRTMPMDLEAFSQLLESLGLAQGVQVQAIFDLIDTRNEGVVTLGKLVAALQSGGAGCAVRLPSEERDQQATENIRGCMAPYTKLASDVKMLVRQHPKSPSPVHITQAKQERTEASPTENSLPPTYGELGLGNNSRLANRRATGVAVVFRAAWSSPSSGSATPQRPQVMKSSPQIAAKDRGVIESDMTKGGERAHPKGGSGQRQERGLANPLEEDVPYPLRSTTWTISTREDQGIDVGKGGAVVMWQTQAQSVPLLGRTHSRYAIHQSVRAHTNALALQRFLN